MSEIKRIMFFCFAPKMLHMFAHSYMIIFQTAISKTLDECLHILVLSYSIFLQLCS
jgi:hypothetical protein